MKQRTDSYICTVNPMSVIDMNQIDIVRKTVATSNKLARNACLWRPKTIVIYRVCLKGRLGKNNPMANKYRIKGYQNISLADAQRIDVYVQVRK